ncbi:MAG: trypsin-like serine protease [Gemmatimonas sp.]
MYHSPSLCTNSAAAVKRAFQALSPAVLSVLLLTSGVAGAQSAPLQPEYSANTSAAIGTSGVTTFGEWVAQKTLVVAGTDFNNVLYSTPKAGPYDGVASLLIHRTDGYFICSGALLAGGLNVLTAAHCLTDNMGVNITLDVTALFFPPGQPPDVRDIIAVSSVAVNPAYTGEIVDAHDVAVVRLSSAPSLGVLNAAYSLYLGDPFGQQARAVGSGGTGTGATGETEDGGLKLADRRTGLNTVDFTWTDPRFNGIFIDNFGSADPFSLVADFDSGLPVNNASCNLTSLNFFSFVNPICELGWGAAEINLGSGDSGGPLFINNQIAGVAGYGLTFRGLGDIDDALNSTFGEFSGWTSTAYNADWITSVTTTAPEPGSFALVGVGVFALIGFSQRRHRDS